MNRCDFLPSGCKAPDVGAVILAGGEGRRMGLRAKPLLAHGGKAFLEQIASQLAGFPEVLLSVNSRERYDAFGLTAVDDIFPNCGPVGGIYSALFRCTSPWLLVVGCDMPLFTRELVEYLARQVEDSYDAVVSVTREGRLHPLCAVYHKRVADVLRQQILAGEFRLLDVLTRLRIKEISLEKNGFCDSMMCNVNTLEEYKKLVSATEAEDM